MKDKSLYYSQQHEISESLQNYIDSMVEEIVLEGKPFDSQKKYLKKFSEKEGLDYEAIEKGITELVETMKEMKTSDSKMLIKLALIQAKDAYVAETTVLNIAQQIGKKGYESVSTKRYALAGIIMSLRSRFVKNETNKPTIDVNVNGVEFCMVKVEGGSFWMGAHKQYRRKWLFSKEPDTSIPNFDENAETREGPVHKVTLDGFYICKTAVTHKLWNEVIGGLSPSKLKLIDDDLPIVSVSYYDIKNVFLPRLNRLTGYKFRLPTEAEWEYAARGGKKSLGFKYAGSNLPDSVAWHQDNSKGKTHPVRTKQANELGLFCMSGNVWELCSDWASSYGSNDQQNPTGPTAGTYRVLRGGSWRNKPTENRISNRDRIRPEEKRDIVGFRLALSM